MLRRKDFIDRFAKKGYTKKDSAIIFDDFVNTLREILREGESVALLRFGSFEIRDYAARSGRSPVTHEPIEVPAFRAVHFTPSVVLKEDIRSGQ